MIPFLITIVYFICIGFCSRMLLHYQEDTNKEPELILWFFCILFSPIVTSMTIGYKTYEFLFKESINN